ncbi:MAG: thioredoxin domain-containing protein [Myxococcota bacterium]|jgi:uncharacterized membrane protein|nr:thioredoxin domain-containing protein [Myxococcota bacterium]
MKGAGAIDRGGEATRWLLAAYLGLSVVGLLVCVELAWIHLRLFTDPSYEAFCSTGTVFDCERVALSRHSVVAGVPLAVWGILGTLWAGALGLCALMGVRRGRFVALAATFVWTVSMAFVALCLLGISALTLRAVCQLCLASHLLTLGLAAIAILASRRAMTGGALAHVRLLIFAARKERLSAALWLAFGVLTVTAPIALIPPYWEVSSFRVGELSTGVGADGLPWLGATHPTVVVHEYNDYECPYCRSAHLKLRRMLEKHSEKLRIVRHDTSRVDCPAQAPKGESVDACRTVRGAYCALQQQSFWQWSDAALHKPRPAPGSARERYEEDLAAVIGLDSARFNACLDSEEAFAFAHERTIEARRAKAFQLPTHIAFGKKVSLEDVGAAL